MYFCLVCKGKRLAKRFFFPVILYLNGNAFSQRVFGSSIFKRPGLKYGEGSGRYLHISLGNAGCALCPWGQRPFQCIFLPPIPFYRIQYLTSQLDSMRPCVKTTIPSRPSESPASSGRGPRRPDPRRLWAGRKWITGTSVASSVKLCTWEITDNV